MSEINLRNRGIASIAFDLLEKNYASRFPEKMRETAKITLHTWVVETLRFLLKRGYRIGKERNQFWEKEVGIDSGLPNEEIIRRFEIFVKRKKIGENLDGRVYLEKPLPKARPTDNLEKYHKIEVIGSDGIRKTYIIPIKK